MNISQLPDGVISSHFLPYLNVRELSRMACVSNRFKKLSSGDSLWYKLWTLFPTHNFPDPSNRDWKAHFTFTHTVNFRMSEAQAEAKINQRAYHGYAKRIIIPIGVVKIVYNLGKLFFYVFSLKKFPSSTYMSLEFIRNGVGLESHSPHLTHKNYMKFVNDICFEQSQFLFSYNALLGVIGSLYMLADMRIQYRHFLHQEPLCICILVAPFLSTIITLGAGMASYFPLLPETKTILYTASIWCLHTDGIPLRIFDNSCGIIVGKTHAAAIWTFDKLNKLTNSLRRCMHGDNLRLLKEKIFTAWTAASQVQVNNNISAIRTFVCSSPSLFLISHLGSQNHHYDRFRMENRTIKKTNVIGGIALMALGALSEMAGDKTVAGLSMSSGLWFVIKGIVPQRTFNNFCNGAVKKTQAVAALTFNTAKNCVRRFTRLFW